MRLVAPYGLAAILLAACNSQQPSQVVVPTNHAQPVGNAQGALNAGIASQPYQPYQPAKSPLGGVNPRIQQTITPPAIMNPPVIPNNNLQSMNNPQPVVNPPVVPNPIDNQPPSVAPQPLINTQPPVGNPAAGHLYSSGPCFVNMENGYHATDDTYFVKLEDNSGVVAAGYTNIDAVRYGTAADTTSAYPGAKLNFALSYVRPGAQSGQGTISVCKAQDPNVPPERAQCQQVQGAFNETGNERPIQQIGVQTGFAITQDGNGHPSIAIDQELPLSTHHPVYAFAAPGKCFKDFQSPLVLDLSRSGTLQLTSVWDNLKPVFFAMSGNGQRVRTGWVKPSAGLLALDLNGNGKIDSGAELFGEFFKGGKSGAKTFENGFAALAQFDENHDGKIDANDPIFNKLVVWQDLNGDGVTQKSELKTLKQLHVKEISLAYERTGLENPMLVAGNEVRLISTFTMTDGKKYPIADVWFKERRDANVVARH